MTTPAQNDPMVKGWQVTSKVFGGGYITRDQNIIEADRVWIDDDDLIIEEVEHPLSWWEHFEANAPSNAVAS